MAEYSAIGTLSTPGGNITFNDPASSIGFHDPSVCDGLDPQAPGRATNDDKPRTSGGIVYPTLYGPRPIVLGGTVVTAVLSTRETFLAALATALDSIMDGGGTYSWTSVLGTKTISNLTCDVPMKSTGAWIKRYQFGLIAPSHLIT